MGLFLKLTMYTLYIDINSTVVFNNLRILRYNGEGESVVHLMSKEHGL